MESKLINSFGVNGKKCAYLEEVIACIVAIKIKIITVLRALQNFYNTCNSQRRSLQINELTCR